MNTFTTKEMKLYESHMTTYMISRPGRVVLNEFHNQTINLILKNRTI